MKINIFYSFKIDQTRTFDSKGNSLVVSRLKADPQLVKRIKTKDKDGYWAVQVVVGKGSKKRLKEIRVADKPSLKTGDKIKISDLLKEGDLVKATGKSKGKGFAGVVKRWGFKGGPRTHGQSDRQRAPGSIGQSADPGRVWKGKKMAGRMGGETVSIQGLSIFKIDEEKNQVWLTGLVPGSRGSLVKITKV